MKKGAAPDKVKTRAVMDLFIFLTIGVIVLVVAYSLNLFETVVNLVEANERWQLDEVFIAIAVLLPLALIYSLRRWQETRYEIQERSRTEALLRHSTQRLKILHAIDQNILGAQSAEQVAKLVLEAIFAEVPIPAVSIALFDADAQEESVYVILNREDTSLGQASRFPLTVLSDMDLTKLRQGETQILDAISRLSQIPPGIRALEAQGIPVYFRVPLNAEGALMGCLNVGVQSVDALSRENLDVIREVADQFAIAIQQARFREQIRQHAEQLEERVAERTLELLEVKEHIERILNSSSDAIILVSGDGKVRQINPAFKQLFGFHEDEALGQSLMHLIRLEDGQRLQAMLAIAAQTGESMRVEGEIYNKNGDKLDVDIALAPLVETIGENHRPSVVCSLRDISQRKKVEEGLRLAVEKEKELNQLKTRFISMVSHDFRNPLAAIQSSSDILKIYTDRLTEAEKLQKFETIQLQVNHLISLLDDVLLIGRAESTTISRKPLDLPQLCQMIIEEQRQIVGKPERIAFSVDGVYAEILGDEKLLRQIITNLLTNAIKYSPQDTVVQFDVIYEDEHVVIRVQDQGIGISKADQAHLFKTFYRASNVGSIPGTGLGLAIVKMAVEAHGGTLTLESEPGMGSTFTTRLPIAA